MHDINNMLQGMQIAKDAWESSIEMIEDIIKIDKLLTYSILLVLPLKVIVPSNLL